MEWSALDRERYKYKGVTWLLEILKNFYYLWGLRECCCMSQNMDQSHKISHHNSNKHRWQTRKNRPNEGDDLELEQTKFCCEDCGNLR